MKLRLWQEAQQQNQIKAGGGEENSKKRAKNSRKFDDLLITFRSCAV